MAAILYLLCLAVAEMTGWNIFALIAVVGLSTVIYTFFGGIEGVVWTDVAQGFLLLAAGLVCFGFILLGTPGGPAAVIDTAWTAGKFKLVSGGFAWDRAGPIVLLFFGLNFYLQKYAGDQTVVQRYLLAPSTGKARRALWVSSALVLFVWVLFLGIGALLWAHYQLQPGLLPAGLHATPDKVFPYFMAHGLPAGVTGFVLAGLLAATMSTLASDLNSLSAVVFNDYYRRFRRAESDGRHLVFSRLVVLGAGLLGVLLAMAMTRIASMADAAFDFVALVGGGVLGMYLVGMLTRRCSARGLYVGLAAGVAFVLWAQFCGPGKTAFAWLPRLPLHTLWVGLIGNLIVFCCGYLASRLLPAGPAGEAASPLLSHDQTIKNLP